jgi:hypothetical protein
MAKLMTARYAGKCNVCRQAIRPGDAITYGGRNNTKHTDCSRPRGTAQHVCNVTCDHTPDHDESRPSVAPPADSAEYDDYGPVHYGYNRYGRARCEDAPCCGCC